MSLILNLFAIKNSAPQNIETNFAEYAKSTKGFLKESTELPDEYGVHMTTLGNNTVCLFTSYAQYDIDEIARYLSQSLNTTTLSLGIYEGTMWFYNLYKNGCEEDCFSTSPSQCLREGENVKKYKGNAKKFSSIWGGLNEKNIEKYFFNHEKLLNKRKRNKKAYPQDSCEAWDGWQMVDFMEKLGIAYPFSEDTTDTKDKFFAFENKMSHKNLE